jgi:hypothetical protein
MAFIKSMRYFLLAMAILLSGSAAQAQEDQAAADTVELTNTDITKLASFNASHATIFGIGLGESIQQVKEIVDKKEGFLKIEKDPFNLRRFYLYDVSGDTSKVLLGYLKWATYDSALNEIILYPGISKYMQGLSCSIMTGACMDPESEVYKDFLGKASAETVMLDIPSANLKEVKYYYPKQRLMIEMHQNGSKITYNMVIYRL